MDVTTLPASVRLLALGAALYTLYLIVTKINIAIARRSLAKSRGCLPAKQYPQNPLLFGLDTFNKNIKQIKAKRALEWTQERFDIANAQTYSMVVLGRKIFMTTEPENLKTIQAVDFKKWGFGRRRKLGFRPLLGEGIFTTEGKQWQHSRDMLRPNFVRSQIGDIDTFERHVASLIAALPQDGTTTVDLGELFFRLTMDSATEFLFGESTHSLTTGSVEGFADAFNRSQDGVAKISRYDVLGKFLPKDKQFEKDCKFVHDFVDYYVEKGLQKRPQLLQQEKEGTSNNGRYIFIDELVRQTTDKVQIRSELLNILLAGRDTTASLLTNVWFQLARSPAVFAKLRAEVTQHLQDGEIPSFEQLKDMKYLRAVLNESLRLQPVVPINSREANTDTTLPVGGGPDGLSPIFIPKGTLVAWSLYSMHRRKDYYGADADLYRPERWIDNEATGGKGLRTGWEYLPFNGGPRICLGQQYALTEASYTIVRLCQAFSGVEIGQGGQGPWVEGLTLTCVSANGAKVVLKPKV
ncbi:putative P450 monooxygenase [Polychaeton citri CBS 116435]|uniref:P450 monooxygenase n=1 Tax=Polychaeton citri CBS 116435 TaxID=1314669 RepID=A0A9P4QEX5_9PEZI|nr:putative P450 monooxygenase [Polychaeton citri CBS 116435]